MTVLAMHLMLKYVITTNRLNKIMITRNELRNIDYSDVITGNAIISATPGEILKSEFLDPMGISQYRLAKSIGVAQQRISAIVALSRTITADTDLRLCHFFKLSDGFFLRLQIQHDLDIARTGLRNELDHMPNFEEILAA